MGLDSAMSGARGWDRVRGGARDRGGDRDRGKWDGRRSNIVVSMWRGWSD